MTNDTTKALYEMFPEDEKNSFFNAYLHLKYIDHYAKHIKEVAGLPIKLPEEPVDESIDEMIGVMVQQISTVALDKDTSAYHNKVLQLKDALQLVTQKDDICLETPETVMPYKQAKDVILNNPESIVVGQCSCRATVENPCLPPPMEVCLYVGDPHASFMAAENPKFRKVSQDEAVDILKKAHEMGLVHCAEFTKNIGRRFVAICNCCSCCCMGIQMWNLLGGTVPMLSPSGYTAKMGDGCSGCGECITSCSFNAIAMDEDSQTAVINQNLCMGCGVCENACPIDAISLQLDPSKGEPLDLERLMSSKDK